MSDNLIYRRFDYQAKVRKSHINVGFIFQFGLHCLQGKILDGRNRLRVVYSDSTTLGRLPIDGRKSIRFCCSVSSPYQLMSG